MCFGRFLTNWRLHSFSATALAFVILIDFYPNIELEFLSLQLVTVASCFAVHL